MEHTIQFVIKIRQRKMGDVAARSSELRVRCVHEERDLDTEDESDEKKYIFVSLFFISALDRERARARENNGEAPNIE
jgi:hypothetical protein